MAMALLVAVVASMNAIVNFVNSQTAAVGQLASVGDRYLVLSKSGCLSDSQLSWETADLVKSFDEVKGVFPQKVVDGVVHAGSGVYAVTLRGVENVSAYLKAERAYVNGTVAVGLSEANLGVLLCGICSVNLHESVNVTLGDVRLNIKVVGITQTQTQLDSELIVPIETANYLAGSDSLSFVEFTFNERVDRQVALSCLSVLLPQNVEVVKVQQTGLFLAESIGETLGFLAVWSLLVYVVVAAASYVVSTRLIVDCEYELVTLQAIGAKRQRVFTMVFTYTLVTALAGAFLGLALGIAGAQVASSVLRWVWQGVQVVPFLELNQVGQILALSILFSTLGCVYPAFKSTQRRL